jgi:hypothetical protein
MTRPAVTSNPRQPWAGKWPDAAPTTSPMVPDGPRWIGDALHVEAVGGYVAQQRNGVAGRRLDLVQATGLGVHAVDLRDVNRPPVPDRRQTAV